MFLFECDLQRLCVSSVCTAFRLTRGFSLIVLYSAKRRNFQQRMSVQSNSSFDLACTNNAAMENSVKTFGTPVLSQIHVSCYVNGANRATSEFVALPQHHCVRLSEKVSGGNASTSSQANALPPKGNTMKSLVEWKFHSVFTSDSPSHSVDFFTEITLPALRTAQDGINSNIIGWGVHPTQKYQLLFGKNNNEERLVLQPNSAVNDIVEVYGQLVGLLYVFFSHLDLGKPPETGAEFWRLGISSWIIVNNQTIDLLESVDLARTNTSGDRMDFVSLEAPSLAAALRIVHTAKTNHIVRKQNANDAHFFVRLALFYNGQVSTVHLVDLVDQKDHHDQILINERNELYNMLKELKLSTPSSRLNSKRTLVSLLNLTSKMMLSNFMMPLLNANAKTFLYAYIIDSRSSLRECVRLLNAVSGLKGYKCVCKPIRGVSYDQLCFKACLTDLEEGLQGSNNDYDLSVSSNRSMMSSQYKKVTSSPGLDGHVESINSVQHQTVPISLNETEALNWLKTFASRKQDILSGSVDTFDAIISALRVSEQISPDLALPSFRKKQRKNGSLQHNFAKSRPRPTISDLYERLRESLEDVEEIKACSERNPCELDNVLHSKLSQCKTTPELHTPLPLIVQNPTPNDFAQIQHNESVSERTADPQAQQTKHQLDEELTHLIHHAAKNCFASEMPFLVEESYDKSRSKQNVVEATVLLIPETSADDDDAAPKNTFESSNLDSVTLKLLRKAGVPPCAMGAPVVDGLDVKTAKKVQAADANLLRKNYDALLSIVREQQQLKDAAESRLAETLQDQQEMRATFEIQIESMKLKNLDLRSKVRALENHTSVPQLFEQYEHEISNLHAQIQELQAQNVALELRMSDDGSEMRSTISSPGLKKRYRNSVAENRKLKRELLECRKRERHHQVHSRLAGESTRRVDQLSRDLSVKEEILIATRLSKQRLSTEINQYREMADKLNHENEKLLQEKAATLEELGAARMYFASLENEKKKVAILDQFVKKHGDRMTQDRHSKLLSKSEDWRRDQSAHECENKLLAAITRFLPQALPLCNKLLRRLKMQELTLREFAEREVDLINLLVLLVSDQPANALQQMIEQEMNMLQSERRVEQ
ncbi:putative P-loop containing nucleoside triphosphate hydrolase [Plasmopara halstedii]